MKIKGERTKITRKYLIKRKRNIGGQNRFASGMNSAKLVLPSKMAFFIMPYNPDLKKLSRSKSANPCMKSKSRKTAIVVGFINAASDASRFSKGTFASRSLFIANRIAISPRKKSMPAR